MCGIAGFMRLSGKRPTINLNQMLAAMQHRGPDESGSYVMTDGQAAVGMNRLAITAPKDRFTQPLQSSNGRYVFVFNGQVYNHKALRQELQKSGVVFRTECDSEVLFHLYLRKGNAAFLQAEGMFAGVILDTVARRLHLFRDPCGIKPLYYTRAADFFAFASEIRPLLQLVPATINRSRVSEYLQFRYVSGDECLFAGVHKVLPGTVIQIDQTGAEKAQSYFDLQQLTEAGKDGGRIGLTEFAEVLQNSIRLTGQSDFPVASMLSGGLDSSLTAQVLHDSQQSFAPYFFDNGYDSDERQAVMQLQEHWQKTVHSVTASAELFSRQATVLRSLEEPLGDSIILPTDVLLENISNRYRVVLSGEGADELFAGYVHHFVFTLLRRQRYLLQPQLLRLFVQLAPAALLNLVLPHPGKIGKARLFDLVGKINAVGQGDFYRLIQLFDENELQRLMPDTTDFAVAPVGGQIHHLRDLMNHDIRSWLPNYNLLRMDKLGMRHSLEVRLPYLNISVLRASFRLRERDFISLLGQRKNMLARAAARRLRLPRQIAYRKKHPFTFREKQVFQKRYADFVQESITQNFLNDFGFAEPAVRKILNHGADFLQSKQAASIVNLALWHQAYFTRK